jgi:hypothetical protein
MNTVLGYQILAQIYESANSLVQSGTNNPERKILPLSLSPSKANESFE